MGNGVSMEDDPQFRGQMNGYGQYGGAAPNRRSQGFQEVELRQPGQGYSNQQNNMADRGGNNSWNNQNKQQNVNNDDRYYGNNAGAGTSNQNNGYNERQHKNGFNMGQIDQPQYTNEDLVFETFFHKSGDQYTCLYQRGERFYMDSWSNGDWKSFPMQWYNEGFLVTDSIVRGDDDNPEDEGGEQNPAFGSMTANHVPTQSSVNKDDREGFIKHPNRGLLATYLFEEKRNVHCFFDENSGEWVKLPIAWELHAEHIDMLVTQIEDALPEWNDKHDILAALRMSNYDPHDCIANYLTIGDHASMTSPRSAEDAKAMKLKDEKMKELEKKYETLTKVHEHTAAQLRINKQEKTRAQEEVQELQERVSELEVKARKAKVQVESMHQELLKHKEEKLQKTATQLKEEQKIREQAEDEAMELKMKVQVLDEEHKYTKEQLEKMEKDKLNMKKEGERRRALEEEKAKLQVQLAEQLKAAKQGCVDNQTIMDLNDSTKALHKSYLQLKMCVKSNFGGLVKLCQQACEAAKNIVIPEGGAGGCSNEELEKIKALYRKEGLRRKLLFNQLQDLKGNIRVFARCRKDDRVECCMEFPTDEEIFINKGNTKKTFEFNRVFGPDSTQEEVFADTLPVVTSCVDGYNVSILAYGQTGSGKTFTMMGPPDNPGVNVRAIQELLRITDERDNVNYSLNVSMVEIYNENVIDLLTKDCKVLNVQAVGNKVDIAGLSWKRVASLDDITDSMERGMDNRHTAATKMNSTSSRSHLLVMLKIEGVDKTSGTKSRGTLTLVDLAGSERVGKTEASGKRLVEAAAINKSLTSLGLVFSALRTGQLHIPYRNSKLTHILQPSLGGDAKACLFVAMSPAESNLSETISTLTFGSNARQVTLGQAKANVSRKK